MPGHIHDAAVLMLNNPYHARCFCIWVVQHIKAESVIQGAVAQFLSSRVEKNQFLKRAEYEMENSCTSTPFLSLGKRQCTSTISKPVRGGDPLGDPSARRTSKWTHLTYRVCIRTKAVRWSEVI